MFHPVLRLVVALHVHADRARARLETSERGQSTAEYAMVLGGIALLVAVVFTQTDVFKTLFDKAIALIKIGGQ